MKLSLLFLLLSSSLAWGKPIVLLGYFDAFGNDPFNNSEVVSRRLFEKLKDHKDLDLRLCPLKTVFDKSYAQLETCLKNLPSAPKLILGLGESNCNLKIETIVKNLDTTKGPDNEGNERNNEIIIPEAAKFLGLNYPLAKMYCSLPYQNRKNIQVSNDAGTFVCNNMAFQFSHYYPETSFGFIHVPANNCRKLERKTSEAVESLEKMIIASARTETESFERLSTTKNELEKIRYANRNDKCLSEFYNRTKGIDEKGLWPF